MNNLAPSDLRVGLNALTGTLLTAIEATSSVNTCREH
jgi:hypothetical protein